MALSDSSEMLSCSFSVITPQSGANPHCCFSGFSPCVLYYGIQVPLTEK
ncbi:hypothetical protein E2C01_052508 [Portunus trituberculatus]|uniref:Uncharacterized protein n=1 Tax=Portunus trituberculatus TaxID=210409 RepID=A0A5B7GHV4_PORTR|nr:hypothetical protein [Portunus trituberculatus]